VDIERARAFIAEHHRAVIVTLRADGRPQPSPVMASVDGDGRAVISSRETAYKVRHLRRDPRVSLCVMSDGFFGDWVFVEGTATILSLPEAMEPLVDYYRRVAGEHSDWDDYRRAMERERRVMICVDISRAGPDRQG
jgi:PPOX class probable F420-dependent enzyme